MAVIAYIVHAVINLYIVAIFVSIVFSWLIAFGVVNGHNQFVSMILGFTNALTEPLLRPIRRIIPPIGGSGARIDLSPLILIIGLNALKMALDLYVFFPARQGL